MLKIPQFKYLILKYNNRVEGSRMAPPLPLHRTYGSRIRRYINCKSISDFIEIVCKGRVPGKP